MWFTSPTLQVEKHAGHGWGASGQKIPKVTAHDMERFFSEKKLKQNTPKITYVPFQDPARRSAF
jgi:hypothetical protein